jgi:hypothetical protein
MEKAAMARAIRRGSSLPEEIVVWEILVRLPPKSLLRCRSVCHAWCRAISARNFLLAHHGRQPSLPVVCAHECLGRDIFAFDRRAAHHQLKPVARLDGPFGLAASCDGLLIVSTYGVDGYSFSVCNPATRQLAPLVQLSDFRFFSVLLGMYLHRPTGEYRLLLHRRRWTGSSLLPEDPVGCYIYALGSDQPPKFIGGPKTTSMCFNASVLLRDNLHWYPAVHDRSGNNPQTESKPVIVFNTIAESFWQMHAPVVPINPYMFEMDGTLGMYTCNRVTDIVDIWVLQDYKCEAWEHKYRVKLPFSEIWGYFGERKDFWYVRVGSADGDVHLLIHYDQSLFCVDTDGKLVKKFHLYGQELHACQLRLKQTLVQHTFFSVLEDYDVHTSPFSTVSISL